MMKHPNFNWQAEDKYNELKKLQVRGKQHLQIVQHTMKSNYKKLARQKRPKIHRITNPDGTRKM